MSPANACRMHHLYRVPSQTSGSLSSEGVWSVANDASISDQDGGGEGGGWADRDLSHLGMKYGGLILTRSCCSARSRRLLPAGMVA